MDNKVYLSTKEGLVKIPQNNSWSIKDWEIYLDEITKIAQLPDNVNLINNTYINDMRSMLNDWKKEHQEYESKIERIREAGVDGEAW